MTTEQYSIGYDAGYQDGFDAALAEPYACEAGECPDKSLCAGACECLFKAEPVKQEPVTIESAEKMGATGAIPTESERKLFEAWMRGHCWAISGVWDGKTYVDSAETGGYINPLTMHVRCLWAAWRDRAALGAPVQPVQEPVAWMNTNGAVNKLREAGWAMNTAPVAAKARAEALEEAAKVCQRYHDKLEELGEDDYQTGRGRGAIDCAAAIRARGEK